MTITPELRALREAMLAERRAVTIPVEYREGDDDGADHLFVMTGHAAVFGRRTVLTSGKSYVIEESIKRGAFRKALDDHQDVVALWNHDSRMVLARIGNGTLELREDPRGLYTSAQVADTSYARDLQTLMKRGDVNSMSFGFTVAEDRWTEERDDDGNVKAHREIVRVDRLFDVSPVTIPAYPQTSVQARSAELAEAWAASMTNTPDGAEAPAEELRGDAAAEAGETPAQDGDAPESMGAGDGAASARGWHAHAELRLRALNAR
jgi:HK97 family phage prohead protease